MQNYLQQRRMLSKRKSQRLSNIHKKARGVRAFLVGGET